MPAPAVTVTTPACPSILIVDYDFLTCGRVFGEGLEKAAHHLGARAKTLLWNDAQLPHVVETFKPDLILVVHGRSFAQRWGQRFQHCNTAVWLLDEPYEVDDTSRWSKQFGTVFLNDEATVGRHRNAHYLPVCFDERLHFTQPSPRSRRVGFIGGSNATRERYLCALAAEGVLDYVVGGPWSAPSLKKLALTSKLSPLETSRLYRDTQIVVNVFREVHHFNRQKMVATAINPRIAEALACGALVVSEQRAGIERWFPELPQFETPADLVAFVKKCLREPRHAEQVRQHCAARLAGHTYLDRLKTILDVTRVTRPDIDCIEPPRPETMPMVVNARVIPIRNATAVKIETAAVPARPMTAPPALPSATRRHLIYHVWPKRNSNWRWNIEQLLLRMELFNGKRVIGIVEDRESDPAAAVMELIGDRGCEFVVQPNDPAGEAVSFPRLLEKVASTDADEVTFYGHAKGVKYGMPCPQNVQRWTESLYRAALDDWPTVRTHLSRFAMTGSFRMMGRVSAHRNGGDWHYSGTFFWMRNSTVFARAWDDIQRFYYGVEAWPGGICRKEEAGCLLIDELRSPLPYLDEFWRRRGRQALAEWEARRRDVDAPTDLVDPLPFDGFVAPRLEHKPDEFRWWLELLKAQAVQRLLILGSSGGGVEWHTARVFREAGMDIAITCVEPRGGQDLAAAMTDASTQFQQQLRLFACSPQDPTLRAQLYEVYDAVLIDGGHGYADVQADFRLALSFGPKLVGFHDIVDSDWHAGVRCCVSRFWREVAERYPHDSNSGSDWAGIGVVFPQRALNA